jgi:hypothetical protein
MRELIAYNGFRDGDEHTWVALDSDTIRRGLKLKPVTDPILKAIVGYVDAYMNHYAEGWLDAELVAGLSKACQVVLPELEESCWYGIVANVAQLWDTAAAGGVGVHHG